MGETQSRDAVTEIRATAPQAGQQAQGDQAQGENLEQAAAPHAGQQAQGDQAQGEDLVRGLTPKQLATFQRNTDSFKKGRPYFHMGSQTFSQYMEYFDIALKEAQFEPPIYGEGAIAAIEAEKKICLQTTIVQFVGW